jgi:hypothetical protein
MKMLWSNFIKGNFHYICLSYVYLMFGKPLNSKKKIRPDIRYPAFWISRISGQISIRCIPNLLSLQFFKVII